ncbi:parallel beta-helix repeat (two copies) [Pseudomonas sp. GM84]|uniref:right-handed parallel beta-helix repeat-containing protein n=1 Tax=Pseudomonas sp. GM84 TaxID=1144340 RepID=UPI00026F5E8B|nr:right-handed parallel beta-helix repeat-containing protein [Pseudomonas sp. GM84]EJN40123.1 parallel beta-helix repeat (two copies) [Pseudomonas sp. GM84]HYQ54427.1 right-handed parallel beta-helix repeat-containing protein [Pseudomonas sp.]
MISMRRAVAGFVVWSALSSGVFAGEVVGGGCDLPARVGGEIRLQAGCRYNATVVISKSDTTLDCAGATLDGQGVRNVGIQITGRGKKIKNINVKNCRVENFTNRGVNVTSGVAKSALSKEVRENYRLAPENVVLENIQVLAAGRGGVYFDSYVFNSTLKDSLVQGAGKVGVYLEQGTRGISILNNTIKENGASTRREGLAIDSSAHNVIEGNVFEGNAGGGIFLYKNCGENFKSGKSVLRWQSSDFNRIVNNEFRTQPVGVWIASRQSRDLSKWGCGDPALDKQGRFYADSANNNLVESNRFCGVGVPVRVEGDNNYVGHNKIDVESASQVVEPFRDAPKPDGRKSVGNRFVSNTSYVCK